MPLLLPFPNIDPNIFSIELFGLTLTLRWYALAYVAGLVLGWQIIAYFMRQKHLWPNKPPMTSDATGDLLTWLIIGVVLGGRLGFVFFYEPEYYLANPNEILMIWQGGMAFHGGFIGVIVMGALFCWKNKLPILSVGDGIAIATPLGLFFGRIANFIKPELWGRPTDVPWAVYFPDPYAQMCPAYWDGLCTRHPSQLYEAILEGLVLGLVMVWMVYRRKAFAIPGQLIGVFFLGYGLARVFVENFRQADEKFVSAGNPFGHVIRFGEYGITQGQLLSIPMVLIGIAIIVWSRRRA